MHDADDLATGYFPVEFRGDTFLFPRETAPDSIRVRMRRSTAFYEARLLEFLGGRADGGRWAIDCGANIGNHSVFFAGVLKLKTFSFEPVETNRAALQAAVAANDLENMVTVVPNALGAEAGTVFLSMVHDGNPGSFRVDETGTHQAQVVTLDGYFADHAPKGRLGLLKVDVEGAEADVLRGGLALIAEHRPLVVLEITSMDMLHELSSMLSPMGYHAVRAFGRTPTIVFDRTERLAAEPEKIAAKIADYEAVAKASQELNEVSQ